MAGGFEPLTSFWIHSLPYFTVTFKEHLLDFFVQGYKLFQFADFKLTGVAFCL